MKLTLAFILAIIISVGLVAFGFTIYQSSTERNKLIRELEIRTQNISGELLRADASFLDKLNQSNIEQVTDSLNNIYDLLGFAIYFNHDSILSNDYTSGLMDHSVSYISQSITADTALGNIFKNEGRSIYQYIKPIRRTDISYDAVIFYNDAEYIDKFIGSIWFRNFIRWFVQAFLVSLVTLFIIRWGIFDPINKIANWAKAVRTGNTEQKKPQP